MSVRYKCEIRGCYFGLLLEREKEGIFLDRLIILTNVLYLLPHNYY